MFDNNPNKLDHLNDPTTVRQVMQSEMHQNYQRPNLKKAPVTRAKRMEQFFWHEFYDEYIRSKERLEAMRPEIPITEYFEEFGRSSAHLIEKRKQIEKTREELRNKFPLYSTAAISVWNPTGEFACTFKRTASVTIPTSAQRGQFDV